MQIKQRHYFIKHLFQGLDHLIQLVNLNLSNNYISCLANLAHLPNLQTLTLTRQLNYKQINVREAFIKKKKSVTFFTLGSDPPPLFCVKCDEKLIYFLSIIRAYLGHIEPIKIFYPQNHLKKYEKSAKI